MTKDEAMRIALEALGTVREWEVADYDPLENAITALRQALEQPEQEPVACQHNRYSVDVHEQTGTCYDCGAEGRMRFVVDDIALPKQPEQYDQTALELCDVCGWKTLIPDDGCLNCERGKPWVGLTDEEIWELYTDRGNVFARAIEAKLKEKNK